MGEMEPNDGMIVRIKRGSLFFDISLQCTLCNYQFRSPKILPCYHSFCEACLYAVVAKSSTKSNIPGVRIFACPICRQKAEVQKGGAHTLQTNFVLAAHVIKLNLNRTTPECGVCAKKRKANQDPVMATLKCWECDKFLCNKCLEVHRNLLKFHTLIHLHTAGPPKVYQFRFCGIHPDEHLRFYCLKCEETICRDCRMTSHGEGHKSVDIGDLNQTAKELVAKVNEIIVENFIPVLDSNTKFFQQENEDKLKLKPVFVQAIKEREKVLMKLVQQSTREAMKHLEEVMSNLDEDGRKCKDALARMTSETEFNELVIQSGGEADIMQAAMNVLPYANPKSPQACMVKVGSQKSELVWSDAHEVATEPQGDCKQAIEYKPGADATKERALVLKTSTFNNHPIKLSLKDFKTFADLYLGRVELQKTDLTLNVIQDSEKNNLHKMFRKIHLLAEAFRKNYKLNVK